MLVRELRKRLEAAATILSDWGSRSSDLADLEKLAELLSIHDTLTVSEFCNRMSRNDAADAGVAGARRARQVPVNTEIVNKYVEMLSSADLDRPKFASLMSDVSTDKAAKLPELSAIANQLAGTSENSRTRLRRSAQ